MSTITRVVMVCDVQVAPMCWNRVRPTLEGTKVGALRSAAREMGWRRTVRDEDVCPACAAVRKQPGGSR